jgi:hypothetical protein
MQREQKQTKGCQTARQPGSQTENQPKRKKTEKNQQTQATIYLAVRSAA